MSNLTEALNRIETVGKQNARIVEAKDGKVNVEIFERDAWTVVLSNVQRVTAENILGKGKSVILG